MPAPYRACLIDALGTMVRLLPPWERIDPAAIEGLAPERVRERLPRRDGLLRRPRRAGPRRRVAGRPAGRLRGAALRRARPADRRRDDDGRDRVRGLSRRRAGAARAGASGACGSVCVSNWDYELGDVLERIGLAGELDGVVTSAAAGARKPDPAIFELGLRIAGCQAAEAFHVGDGDEDVEGARAAGIDAIRIDRGGGSAATYPRSPRSRAAGPDGQNDEMSEPEQPSVGSTPPPATTPGGRASLPPPSAVPGRSTPPPRPLPDIGSSPAPGQSDRPRTGGFFLTRYVGIPETGWSGLSVALGVMIARRGDDHRDDRRRDLRPRVRHDRRQGRRPAHGRSQPRRHRLRIRPP